MHHLFNEIEKSEEDEAFKNSYLLLELHIRFI